jgi:hypothetical protein
VHFQVCSNNQSVFVIHKISISVFKEAKYARDVGATLVCIRRPQMTLSDTSGNMVSDTDLQDYLTYLVRLRSEGVFGHPIGPRGADFYSTHVAHDGTAFIAVPDDTRIRRDTVVMVLHHSQNDDGYHYSVVLVDASAKTATLFDSFRRLSDAKASALARRPSWKRSPSCDQPDSRQPPTWCILRSLDRVDLHDLPPQRQRRPSSKRHDVSTTMERRRRARLLAHRHKR